MRTLSQLRTYCTNKSEEYPDNKSEIWDMYSLAYAEVEEGGSEPHEVELAIGAIAQIVNE